MKSGSLFDFPILTEELELVGQLVLQKRLSSCGSQGALTIKMHQLVVCFGVLDRPGIELADCIDEIKSNLATRDNDSGQEWESLGGLQPIRDAIVAEGADEIQLLIGMRSALRARSNAETIASARSLIEQSRTKISHHRQLMDSADEQLLRCEKNLVWSRLRAGMDERPGDPSSASGADSAEREIRLVLEKRAMMGEERRVIWEAEAAIADSAGVLGDGLTG